MDDLLKLMKEASENSARYSNVTVNLFFWQRIIRELEELRHNNEVLSGAMFGDDRRREPARLWSAARGDNTDD